ncbi:membrane protein insertion efficiency factor YidD [Modestobacter sp. VKM Ac-2986]|uniref:membrane protein insertion efficiency factor YidD n=1 Tax=Modestobacter sp. VKM Ac-2986 TaxID=3004140 RepID=UPI0022AAE006|nr:membrane protein insertion efficiency factor YidD [Modestobacter sp. VKM Ac-2986]MCZ2827387.1 membrane protein insertion efficiency factor YidD [Modestobacter sp. VKM Ac-2986]
MTASPARALLAAVRFYQRAISPAFPPRCRFEPSCSAYAAEALEVHGAARGSWLAVKRLAKCAPWHPGGLDLVPARPARSEADGTVGEGRSSSTSAQSSAPPAAPAPPARGARRPGRATPPAPRRSAQQEAGVA